MTIAAGFVCDKGIVMCADSQETYGDLKWSVQKLVTHNFGNFCPMMISGAGFGPAIDSATQQIISRLEGGYERRVALELIREVLRDIYKNDLRFFPSDSQLEKQFELLIAFKSTDMQSTRLYKTVGSLIQEVRDYPVIGSGTLVTYYAHALHQRYMPMSRGTMLAAHLIRLAKTQLTSVGGSSWIATLDHKGKIEYASPWELPDTERMFGEFTGLSGQLMLQCADPTITEEAFVRELSEFWKNVIKFKQQQIENRQRWEEVWSVLSGTGRSGDVNTSATKESDESIVADSQTPQEKS